MKQQYQIYKLHFTTPVHFSDERDDYSKSLAFLHSDSLQAALMAVLAKAGYTVPADGDLGFVVSSLFPYYQNKKTIGEDTAVYFFPKIVHNETVNADLLEYSKSLKGIEWVDQFFFQKQLRGEKLFDHQLNTAALKGSFLTEQELAPEGVFVRQQSARVAVPRQHELDGKIKDAEPFYMERIHLLDRSGLFFLAEGAPKAIELLEKGLHILGSEGLGTDRTVGNGFFEWEKSSLVFEVEPSNHAVNLSMFLPQNKKELEDFVEGEDVAYKFMKRGGWITTPPYGKLRKNSVYMLSEGSVLKTGRHKSSFVAGRIADLKPQIGALTPDHSIYRNGKAIFIPLIIA